MDQIEQARFNRSVTVSNLEHFIHLRLTLAEEYLRVRYYDELPGILAEVRRAQEALSEIAKSAV